ncbi:MAG: hypothetical protein OET90_00250, partial [Desulfuromonadales bacterium]|nr:hypothetical protein [Desulfuromonadales bacterium]
MNFSLKAKTLLLIFLTMAVTAVAVIYFSDRDISRAIMTSEEGSARNIIQLVDLNVKQTYSQLLSSRVSSMQRHKTMIAVS